MGNPYSSVAIANFNADPPSDDASEVAGNQLGWDKHKEKLADPIKNLAEGINTNTSNAFGNRFGATFELKTGDYLIAAPGDQGKFFSVTGTTTMTLPVADDAGNGFPVGIVNNGTATVTVDGNGSETINGNLTVSLTPGSSMIITCDGSNWAGFITNQPWDSLVKTADEVVTTSITLQDDDHLVGFSLVAGKYYSIEALLWVTESIAGDFDYAWIFTDAPQHGRSAHHNLTAGSTDKGVTPIATRDQVTIESGSNLIKIEATFQANASAGGTFKLQWCQGTSSGITTLLEDSWVKVTQLN